MTKFLKLSNMILNPSNILRITHNKDVYSIYTKETSTIGFSVIGSGSVTSGNDVITVCKEKHSSTYSELTRWIFDEHGHTIK